MNKKTYRLVWMFCKGVVVKKVDLEDDVNSLILRYLENLTDKQLLHLFGATSISPVAYQDDELFCVVIGTEADIAACNERAARTGSPFPGVRAVGAQAGGIYVNQHGGEFWIEGGGTIAGGLTVVGVEPDADLGIKNIMLRRGGARAYRVAWAYVAAFGEKITPETVIDRLQLYLE